MQSRTSLSHAVASAPAPSGRAARRALVVLALLAASATASAQAPGSAPVLASVVTSTSTNGGSTSATYDGAQTAASPSTAGLFVSPPFGAGQASSPQQTLRAGAWAAGGILGAGEYSTASAVSSFKTTPVTFATAPGANPWGQVQVDLQLDGLMRVAARPMGDDVQWWGDSTAELHYRIFDLDTRAYRDDGFPILDLIIQAGLRSDYGHPAQQASLFWQTTAYLYPGSVDEEFWISPDYFHDYVASGTHSFDTGLLTFLLDVDAGDRLVADASLSVRASDSVGRDAAWPVAFDAFSDFTHTFDVEWTALDGARLDGDYQPGVFRGAAAAVPEPTSIALLGLGLAGLGTLRRRRR